jgi:hypothetical protein
MATASPIPPARTASAAAAAGGSFLSALGALGVQGTHERTAGRTFAVQEDEAAARWFSTAQTACGAPVGRGRSNVPAPAGGTFTDCHKVLALRDLYKSRRLRGGSRRCTYYTQIRACLPSRPRPARSSGPPVFRSHGLPVFRSHGLPVPRSSSPPPRPRARTSARLRQGHGRRGGWHRVPGRRIRAGG